MSSDALTVNITTDPELSDAHLFGEDDDEPGISTANIDARRKLEDKLEELRLKRDLKEYDFDF